MPWDSHEGRSLMKLLPPSANAINFRIAHELAHLEKHDWLWGVVLSPLMLVSGYQLSVFLCKCKHFLKCICFLHLDFLTTAVFATKIQLAFPFLFSLTIFAYTEIKTLISELCVICLVCIMEPWTHFADHWQEYRADQRAAMCSLKYAQGGIELMRNTMQLEALFGWV